MTIPTMELSEERLREIEADEGNGLAARMMAREILSRRSGTLPSGVMGKPLEWVEDADTATASALGITYNLFLRDGLWKGYAEGWASWFLHSCATNSEAKAAAQADLNARILSALDLSAIVASPQAEPVAESKVSASALDGLISYVGRGYGVDGPEAYAALTELRNRRKAGATAFPIAITTDMVEQAWCTYVDASTSPSITNLEAMRAAIETVAALASPPVEQSAMAGVEVKDALIEEFTRLRRKHSSPTGDAYTCGQWDMAVRLEQAAVRILSAPAFPQPTVPGALSGEATEEAITVSRADLALLLSRPAHGWVAAQDRLLAALASHGTEG